MMFRHIVVASAMLPLLDAVGQQKPPSIIFILSDDLGYGIPPLPPAHTNTHYARTRTRTRTHIATTNATSSSPSNSDTY